jgi:potassium inwardly-rectifying channel subfamily J
MFRVGNMRNSSLVEAHVRAILISKRVTEEGEVQPYHQTELKVNHRIHTACPLKKLK